jgi:outer membrane protein TolC
MIVKKKIKAAQKKYEAAQTRVKLLRSLEDPSIEYEYDKIIPEMTGETNPMHSYSVSQNLPFPTKLFLRKEAAQKEKEAQKAEYEEKKNEVIQKVKEAYFMLSLSVKQIQIVEDTKILLDGLIKTLTNRYSLGQASQQDVLKAQAEYAKVDNRSILFGQKKRIARAMLKALLNRPQQTELAEPAAISQAREITLDKEKIFNLVRERRPELKSYQATLKQAEINYSLAKQEYLPELMFKYARREKDGEMGEWTGMFGASFPLWFWDKQAPMVDEAKKEKEAMQAMYQDFENMALYEAEAALAKVESGEKLAKLYETSFLPQAEAAYKATSSGFEAGRNNFLDLLDSERMLLEFKLDYAMALVDLEIAYAELERAVGMELK